MFRGATLLCGKTTALFWDTSISPGTDAALLVMEYSAEAFDHALSGPL